MVCGVCVCVCVCVCACVRAHGECTSRHTSDGQGVEQLAVPLGVIRAEERDKNNTH